VLYGKVLLYIYRTTLTLVPIIILDIKAVPGLDVYYTYHWFHSGSVTFNYIENTMYNIMLFRLLHYTSVLYCNNEVHNMITFFSSCVLCPSNVVINPLHYYISSIHRRYCATSISIIIFVGVSVYLPLSTYAH